MAAALSSPPGLPSAGTHATGSLAAPTASSVVSRHPALPVGSLGSRRHAHRDGTVWRDPSPGVGRPAALVSDVAVDDPHTEPILRIAGTAPSANNDAPRTVEGRARRAGGAALGRLPRFGKNYWSGL